MRFTRGCGAKLLSQVSTDQLLCQLHVGADDSDAEYRWRRSRIGGYESDGDLLLVGNQVSVSGVLGGEEADFLFGTAAARELVERTKSISCFGPPLDRLSPVLRSRKGYPGPYASSSEPLRLVSPKQCHSLRIWKGQTEGDRWW